MRRVGARGYDEQAYLRELQVQAAEQRRRKEVERLVDKHDTLQHLQHNPFAQVGHGPSDSRDVGNEELASLIHAQDRRLQQQQRHLGLDLQAASEQQNRRLPPEHTGAPEPGAAPAGLPWNRGGGGAQAPPGDAAARAAAKARLFQPEGPGVRVHEPAGGAAADHASSAAASVREQKWEEKRRQRMGLA
eukprot:CAMPEP_0206046870 /NCGR_PEP_ID=MMETSP1466-20131121/19720_1 /ASSEMBLY_ACC=CAM_ASM_001126 /TAXON_ID=44452 /ORGANISM="Pavlova gyrans, Strain CCMP608" /LENGTH=188 /DNA_ID=CAMNT_0053421863 /DNA_START=33 /DNA_END=596 /DNA_ORIENTATION=-